MRGHISTGGKRVKRKELRHSGCPKSATLKENPAEAGLVFYSLVDK